LPIIIQILRRYYAEEERSLARRARSSWIAMSSVQDINTLIGRPVLSLESANKLGHVDDLTVDPVKGQLVGLSVQKLDESYALVDQQDIHNIGPDAVMISRDESLVSPEQSALKSLPLAKTNLIGVIVITEGGQILGQIAKIYVHLVETSFFIYEVRSSILDKLFGQALFFPASLGCAFSEDATRLVVSDETEKADRKLETVAERLFGPYEPGAPEIIIRSHTKTV
jgi:uncharacterized protein YrrD